MPSPVGHAIAGVAAAWLVAGAPLHTLGIVLKTKDVPATFWREAALFGALGAMPDLDLLVGAHSGPTHSLGAAVVVGVTALVIAIGLTALAVHDSLPDTTARCAVRPRRLALACAAAYASHILLDWLGRDSSPPIGIMALWPVSRDYFESTLHVFMPISRRYHQGWVFVRQNGIALVTEVAILAPVLALTVLLRSRARST